MYNSPSNKHGKAYLHEALFCLHMRGPGFNSQTTTSDRLKLRTTSFCHSLTLSRQNLSTWVVSGCESAMKTCFFSLHPPFLSHFFRPNKRHMPIYFYVSKVDNGHEKIDQLPDSARFQTVVLSSCDLISTFFL